MKADFLEKAVSEIDEKYINEAAEELYKRQGEEIRVTGNLTAKPQKHSVLKTIVGIAAAIGIVAGGFAILDSISGAPVSVDNPLDSSIINSAAEKYDRMVLTHQFGSSTEIYLDIADEYSLLAAELILKLDDITLEETELSAYNAGVTERDSISLYKGELCDEITIASCYTDGILDCTILTKNGVSYKASGDALIRVMEIISELYYDNIVPNILSGNYYLDGNPDSGVYISVSDGKIGIGGDKAYDFIKESCGDKNPDEVYKALEPKEYVISSIGRPDSRPIITEWDKNKKVNANRYEGESFYFHAGTNMESDIIKLFEHMFYFPEAENIVYKESFSQGFIEFAEMRVVDVLGFNGSKLPFGTETEAKAYFSSISGMDGVNCFGDTVLSDYNYIAEESYNSPMRDTILPSDFAKLRYQNPVNGAFIDIFAGQEGSIAPSPILPSNMGLIFSDGVFISGEPNLSIFKFNDGTVVTAKLGGVVYNGGEDYDGTEYYAAEWEYKGIKYSVTGRGCSRDEFIDSVITLIYNVGGMKGLEEQEAGVITGNINDYEMDFKIFYDYFRAIWYSDAGNEIRIDWNDNFFSYDSPLLGFYKDHNGAYMAKKYFYGEYIVYFISENDRESMHQYVVTPQEDGSYKSKPYPDATLPKAGEARFSQYSGIFGYLGLQELCSSTGLDFDLLHNLQFTDYNGVTWERSFNVGRLTCETGVIEYGGKGDEPTILALEFIKSGTEERKYFACTFKKDENGEYKLADFPNEPFEFDITELDYENSDTLNVKELQENVRQRSNEGITGYYMTADFDIYRITEDSYYLIRTMGANQAQWHSYMDIFYYNGEETILVNGYNRCTLYMGGYHISINNDGYVCILGGGDTVHCIKDGEFLTGYHIGYIGENLQIEYMNFTDYILTVAYKNYGTGQEIKYSIDYSLPKSPIYAGIEVSEGTEGTKINGFTFVQEIGEKLNADDYLDSDGFKHLNDEVYLIEAGDAEKIMLKPYQSLVLTADTENGFNYGPEDDAYFGIDVNHLAEFEFGYIKDNVIYELNGGYPIEGFIEREMTSYPEGEYRFYINNYTNEIIYFDTVGVAILRTPDIDEYSFVEDIGEKTEKPNYDIIEVVGKPMLSDNMYLVKASDAKFFALKHGDTMVYTLDNGEGYKHSMVSDDNIEPKLIFQTKNTCFVSIGAISDDKIYTIYNGELKEGDTEFNIYDYLPDGDAEYHFFITNLSQDIHYCTVMGHTVY